MARLGRPVPPVDRATYRGGLGDCKRCDAAGGEGECADCAGYGIRGAYGRCETCDGSGFSESCDDCQGAGEVSLLRCSMCGHFAEPREMGSDPAWAARHGIVGGGWTCENHVDCATCDRWVSEEVVSEDGRCLDCFERAAHAPVALLPERAASPSTGAA